MEMFLRDGEGKGSPAAVMERCSPVQDGLAVCIDGQGKSWGIVSGGCGNMGSDPAGIIVCLKPHIFYVGGGNLFQPYALPDTALGSVKDAAPRKGLLSPCLTFLMGYITHFYGKLVFPVFHIRGDVSMERQVASPMRSDTCVINIDVGFIVHCTEVQNKTCAAGVRQIQRGKGFPIPQELGGQKLPADTGEGAFGRKGD